MTDPDADPAAAPKRSASQRRHDARLARRFRAPVR